MYISNVNFKSNNTTMKKSLRILLIFTLAFIGINHSIDAQDVITKNNGKKITVHIKEVTDTQIKYIEVGDPNEIIFTMDRVLIKSVEFSYGKKMKKESGEYTDEYFYDDKANNLKINFLAIRLNSVIMTYERALTPQTSLETSIKILGFDFFGDSPNTSGVGLDFGYKMKLKGLFKKDGSYRPQHLLHGSYVKPMLGFHFFNDESRYSSRRTEFRLINLGLDFGKQWILNKTLSLDVHLGFHYYGGSERSINSNGTIGYLFGTYGEQEKGRRR